jgi:hypothetical protein
MTGVGWLGGWGPFWPADRTLGSEIGSEPSALLCSRNPLNSRVSGSMAL